VRSDPNLQLAHERYPFVVIWDDHEFSNDCWGAHATYTNGATDELEVDRRRNAEQAFFEYLPIDGIRPGGPGRSMRRRSTTESRIYREADLRACLRLILTDYRTYRPDHLIPEDAYPGTLFLTRGLAWKWRRGRLPARCRTWSRATPSRPSTSTTRRGDAVKAALLAAASDEATSAGAPDPAGGPGRRARELALAHVNAVLAARGATAPLAAAADQPNGFPALTVHPRQRTWSKRVAPRRGGDLDAGCCRSGARRQPCG